ncbi:putative membrane protein [Algoriphagus alkaliphilus]|uniref:Protoporphyrinogen IX oxidase n=1 Tax=Algoriphagus alkaliphilus TaxID=279824 RepID=A0A1G5ZH91_9BACT|nr:CopD family protein [Algoriphagus alkaliphilus]MBA4302441.1 CopD family protein [Cyclobacterium sp.]SDA93957.1 putative membrane protein [Algoriphagus alkaliphilus]
MTFEYVKALHIIFVVTWFAGLFYIVRLFIYQTEALQKPELERNILKPQLDLMSSRLWYIITWPSAVLTLIFGTWVLMYRWDYMELGFMHAKLGFVVLLYIYHAFCHVLFRELQSGKARWTSTQLRIWNEASTILLFAIVFLIVLKSTISMVWGILGLIGLSLTLMLGIRLYKKYRLKKEK